MTETNVLFEDLLAQVRASREDVTTIHWAGYDIEVKKFLSHEDAYGMANNAAQGCITDEGTYLPVYRYCSYGIALVQYYTNITIGDDFNIADLYELVVTTDLIPTIEACIDPAQLNDIQDAVNESIRIHIQSNINALNSKIDEMSASVERVNEFAEKYLSDNTVDSYKKLLESDIFKYDIYKNAIKEKDDGDMNG